MSFLEPDCISNDIKAFPKQSNCMNLWNLNHYIHLN